MKAQDLRFFIHRKNETFKEKFADFAKKYFFVLLQVLLLSQ